MSLLLKVQGSCSGFVGGNACSGDRANDLKKVGVSCAKPTKTGRPTRGGSLVEFSLDGAGQLLGARNSRPIPIPGERLTKFSRLNIYNIDRKRHSSYFLRGVNSIRSDILGGGRGGPMEHKSPMT